MTHQVWRKVSYLLEGNEPSVVVSGGEPFILSQSTWQDFFDAAGWGSINMLTVITNGAWACKESRRKWFLTWWAQKAQQAMNRYSNGIYVSMSNDQYHANRTQVQQAWNWLKGEAEDGYCGDSYFEPIELGHSFYLDTHGDYIRETIPIGRARQWGWGNDCESCGVEIDDNDSYARHEITIWPDGRVSGCCNGGGWVGNVTFMPMDDIYANHLALSQENERLYKGKYGCTREACYHCTQTAHKLFKTSFKETTP